MYPHVIVRLFILTSNCFQLVQTISYQYIYTDSGTRGSFISLSVRLLDLVVEPATCFQVDWLLIVQSLNFSNRHVYLHRFRCGIKSLRSFQQLTRFFMLEWSWWWYP